MKPKAILFDLDGVLVDMPDAHYQALNRALELFGVNIEEDEHHGFFNGLPTRKKLSELERLGRLPTGLCEFLNEIKQQYTKELIPKFCTPDHSKLVLMKHIRAHGIKTACCSNSTKETLHLMLHSSHLHSHFDIIIGNDEVAKPKPDPEMYIIAMEKLGVTPEETIIVEDSPHGVEAAKASGAAVRVVRNIHDVDYSLFADILDYA
jgi:HAD superfamily hydrolase (TIGR01509 family)